MRVTIHQPEHLPWLGLFAKVASADLWIVLDSVAYRKNYFQNRNRILLGGEASWVTVPVHAPFGTLLRDVTIADQPSWQRKYLGRIEAAYRVLPGWSSLAWLPHLVGGASAGDSVVDLNLAIARELLAVFEVSTPLVRSSEMTADGAKTDLLISLCREVGATAYLSGPSGRDYLEREAFAAHGIDLEFFEFEHPIYDQGREAFVPSLAAIDALAHLGADARLLLTTGARVSR
jgi:hypothetical protein